MEQNLFKRLALGTVQFGLDYGISNTRGKIPETEVFEILDFAKENGINYLDTSCAYGNSETVIGKYPEEKKSSFKLISKLLLINSLPIQTIFENTLKNLKTEKLYGYMIHHFEEYKKDPEILKFLFKIKESGKIQKIGFSLYYPSELELLFERKVAFDILQVPYNIFDQRFEPYFQELKTKNIEIHIRSVFLQGLFFKEEKQLSPFFKPAFKNLKKVKELASGVNISIASLSLNFSLINPFFTTVVGIDSIQNLKENLKNLNDFDKVSALKGQLSELRLENENIILPFNWKKQ